MQATLLLSTQRSGSHFLKSLLETRFPSVTCSGELLEQKLLFSNQASVLPSNPDIPGFWPWYRYQASIAAISVLPDQRIPAFAKYLSMLVDAVAPRHLIFDVKYSSIRTLSGYHDTEDGSDDFVTFIKGSGISVLHLIRNNALRTQVSSALAQQTGVWHRTEERSADEVLPRVRLDSTQLLESIRNSQRVTQNYQNRFAGYPTYAEVVYEEIVDEENFGVSGPNLRAIAQLLNLKLSRPSDALPYFKKTTPDDPSVVVENWNEISHALLATEHGWMVQNPSLVAA